MDGSRDPLFGDEYADALNSSDDRRARSDARAAGIAIERAVAAAHSDDDRYGWNERRTDRSREARERRSPRRADDDIAATTRMPTVQPPRRRRPPPEGARPDRPPHPRPDEGGPVQEGPKQWPSIATGGVRPKKKKPPVRKRVGGAVHRNTIQRVGAPPPVVWWGLAALTVIVGLIAVLTRPMSAPAPARPAASSSAASSAASTGVHLKVEVKDANASATQTLVVASDSLRKVAGPVTLPYSVELDAGPDQVLSVLVPQPSAGSALTCTITASGGVTGTLTRQADGGMLDCTTRVSDIGRPG